MAGSALMTLGTRALTANYAGLQTTGHNIANANTVGYSRQTVELETAGGQYSGTGFIGKGVLVSTVTRAHDQYLTNEAATARALAASDETRSQQLQLLEKVFKTGESGLGYASGQLFNAFVDVANKPQDASAREVVLARAGELAASFRAAGNQLENIQAGVTQDLKITVGTVNELTVQIAALNQKIAAAKGSGHDANDLLDQREVAIDKLSEFVQVTTIAADDGTTSVYLGGGQQLVLGIYPSKLTTMPDTLDPTRMRIGMADIGGDRVLPDELLSGGKIAGLLRFQNSDLVQARNLLDQMAGAITGSVNQQQALGLDLGQPANTGAPMFSVGQPRVSGASNNAADAAGTPIASYVNGSGTRVSSVGMTIVDPTELRASDYELFADPAGAPGSYQLTRLSDGSSRSVVAGDVVDGFRIDVAVPAPVAGDRFLLRPVGGAAQNMQRVLGDPKGIAAASPVNATVDSDNAGTMGVASVRAASTALNTNLRASITFTDDLGNYSYTLVDTTGALPTASGSGAWVSGEPIALNGFELQLSGVPRTGDTVRVNKTLFTATDNGNANAMIALRDAAIVGQQTLANGTVVPGDTVTDAYANILANVGVRVQGARMAAAQSASVATEAQKAVTAKSGVNLDEEAARLIQYQQSYQAAAKLLQIAQSVIDTLLQAAGR